MNAIESKTLRILNACGRSFKPGPAWRKAALETAAALEASAQRDRAAAAELAKYDRGAAHEAELDASFSCDLAAEIRAAVGYLAV